jgi:hypothetical protein
MQSEINEKNGKLREIAENAVLNLGLRKTVSLSWHWSGEWAVKKKNLQVPNQGKIQHKKSPIKAIPVKIGLNIILSEHFGPFLVSLCLEIPRKVPQIPQNLLYFWWPP